MNPIMIKLGSINIYWYSIMLLIAFLIGFSLVLKEATKRGIEKDLIYDYALYLIPLCLIGARLYYVLFNINYYASNMIDIFKVWEGGLAIHGGVITGLIYTFYFTNKHGIKFFKLSDIVVTSLILGQAIGRWGNFFNGEAFGPKTTLLHLQDLHIPNFIIDGMHINGSYYIPTFFYESIWCIIGFIIIMILKQTTKRKGIRSSFYLVWYGLGRLYIEGLRTDSLMIGSFKAAQIVSLCMIIIGIILFIYIERKKGNGKHI